MSIWIRKMDPARDCDTDGFRFYVLTEDDMETQMKRYSEDSGISLSMHEESFVFTKDVSSFLNTKENETKEKMRITFRSYINKRAKRTIVSYFKVSENWD